MGLVLRSVLGHNKGRDRMEYVLIGIIMVLVAVWILSIRQRLFGMNEYLKEAMEQIDLQTSLLYDALTALLEKMRVYDVQEAQMLTERILAKRKTTEAVTAMQDVYEQQVLVADAVRRVFVLEAQHPAITGDAEYLSRRAVVEQRVNMVRTSRLLYNDGVTRLNREVRSFPASLFARVMGIKQREPLEDTV